MIAGFLTWHGAYHCIRASRQKPLPRYFNRTFGFGLVITEINEQSGCGVADA
jgi:hypothetical protein